MNLDFWKAQTHDLYQLYSIFIFLTSTITILHFLYHFKWILAGNTFVKWYFTQKIIYNWSKTVLSRQRGGVVGVCEQCVSPSSVREVVWWGECLVYMFWMSCRVISISSCRSLDFSFSVTKSSTQQKQTHAQAKRKTTKT